MNIQLNLTREQAILLLSFFDLGYQIVHDNEEAYQEASMRVSILHTYYTKENEDNICQGLGMKMHELKLEVKDEANLIIETTYGEINGKLKS
jgi:hypothetical protein